MSTARPRPDEALHLVHHHPGRLRMRAEAFRGAAEDVVGRVRAAIETVRGVRTVAHAPRTGSVLVEYEPGVAEPDAILAAAAQSAGLDGVVDDAVVNAQDADPAGVVIRLVKGLDAVTRDLTGGRAGLEVLVPAAIAAASLYSFVEDENPPRFPRWDNLAWWSYSVFVDWHRKRAEGSQGGSGSPPSS